MFIRYSIVILIIAITNDFDKQSYYVIKPQNNSIIMATFYIIAEMTSIFAVIYFLSKYIYKNNEQKDRTPKNRKIKKNGALIYIFLAISAIIAIIFKEYFIPGTILDNSTLSLNENNSHVLYTIFWCFKTIAMCISINYLINRYKNSPNIIYVVLSYLVVFIYILLNISNSRINLIIPIVFLFIITNEVFKIRGKIIFIIFSLLALSIVTVVTIYKNQYLANSNKSGKYVKLLSDTQEYTSNIRPVAYGIEAVDYYKDEITLETLFNDVAGSIPIVSHFINQDNRINHIYNKYTLNGKNESLIIPMVASSKAYFSPYLSFILTDACIVLLMVYDSKSSNKKYENYLETYMNLYLCFILAYSMNGNIQIIIGRLFTKYIPVMIIYGISSILIIKSKNNEKQKSTI